MAVVWRYFGGGVAVGGGTAVVPGVAVVWLWCGGRVAVVWQ